MERAPDNQFVPVFNLQQVADEAVAGAALDEVLLGGEESLAVGRAELVHEVLEQRQLAVLLDLVQRHGVHHRLDHPAVVARHHDLVGVDPQRHVLLHPQILHREDRLREREKNVLFNDALNTFYLRLYGIRHMVKDHSDSEK